MAYNPLQIRDNVENYNIELNKYSNPTDIQNEKVIFSKMYKNVVYANQIIENHKIVNYKAVKNGLEDIENSNDPGLYKSLVLKEYFKLCSKTDNLKKAKIIEKLKKKMDENKSLKCTKILEIGATWCPGCKALKENLKEYDNRIPLEYIDCDTNDDVSSKYGIRSIPVLLFLDDKDEVIKKNVGVTTLNNVYSMISDINGDE